MAPPLERLRISFPYYSRFCDAVDELAIGGSVPAVSWSAAGNDGHVAAQPDNGDADISMGPPKNDNRQPPSTGITPSLEECRLLRDAATTPRALSEMSSSTATVVPALGKLLHSDFCVIDLLTVF